MLLALGRKLALGFVTVSLSLAVLLVGVLHRDGFAQKVLAIHGCAGGITALERVEAHEAVALGHVVLVADDVGLPEDAAELAECVEENLFVDLVVEVVDEELGANIDRLLLVCAGLVDPNGLAVDPDSIENLRGVFGRIGGVEFDETVALVALRHAILRHVHLSDGANLRH